MQVPDDLLVAIRTALALLTITSFLGGCTSSTSSVATSPSPAQAAEAALAADIRQLAPPGWQHDTLGTPPVEPTADVAHGQACDAQLGVARISALFAALNRGQANVVGSLFAPDGKLDAFEITPSITGLIAGTTTLAGGDGDVAQRHAQVPGVVATLSGLDFKIYPPALIHDIGPYPTANGTALGIGPIFWVATGSALQRRGYKVLFGGGKAGLVCGSRLFEKVTLGVLKLG